MVRCGTYRQLDRAWPSTPHARRSLNQISGGQVTPLQPLEADPQCACDRVDPIALRQLRCLRPKLRRHCRPTLTRRPPSLNPCPKLLHFGRNWPRSSCHDRPPAARAAPEDGTPTGNSILRTLAGSTPPAESSSALSTTAQTDAIEAVLALRGPKSPAHPQGIDSRQLTL